MFNDQQISSMIAPHLAPGERVLFRARGVEIPWWTKMFSRLGSLFWRYHVVVATDQRILFVHHAGLLGGKKVKSVTALAWQEIDRAHLGWGIFNKNLSVRSQARQFARTVTLGRFWMKDNFTHAENMIQTWNQARGLPASAPVATLPAAAYGR